MWLEPRPAPNPGETAPPAWRRTRVKILDLKIAQTGSSGPLLSLVITSSNHQYKTLLAQALTPSMRTGLPIKRLSVTSALRLLLTKRKWDPMHGVAETKVTMLTASTMIGVATTSITMSIDLLLPTS